MGILEKSRIEGFNYIIDKSRRSRICFGSTQERNLFPRDSARADRKGHDVFLGTCEGDGNEKLSGRTVTFGRSPRWTVEKSNQSTSYIPIAPKIVKSSYAPFNQTTPRRKDVLNSNPGPGVYRPNDVKRQMRFNESFGGRRTIVPAIEIKCIPVNSDVCIKCGIKCSQQGDYWHNNAIHLCRDCMNRSQKDLQAVKKYDLNNFRAIRDCSFAHHHELFENSIKLMSVRDIRKKVNKEAYLCQYFPLIVN